MNTSVRVDTAGTFIPNEYPTVRVDTDPYQNTSSCDRRATVEALAVNLANTAGRTALVYLTGGLIGRTLLQELGIYPKWHFTEVKTLSPSVNLIPTLPHGEYPHVWTS